MRKFTVTGATETGSAFFMHAVAHDLAQLEAQLKARFGEASLIILEGHCVSADALKADFFNAVTGEVSWAQPA